MTDAETIAIVHKYHAALNAVDLAAVAAMFTIDAEYHSPSVGALVGRDAIMKAMAGYFAEYPDQHAVDESVVLIAPGKVRSRWRLKATAKSTGLPYERKGGEVITVTADGRITRVEVEDA